MTQSSAHFRDIVRRLAPTGLVAFVALTLGQSARSDQPEVKKDKGKVEKVRPDPRLDGYRAPEGFKLRVAAAEPTLIDPAAMGFDDRGNLFVAEWRAADRTYETVDTISPLEGSTTRVRRTRKSSTDVVKKLKDADGDGVYESSEVVVEGCEMPTSLLFWKDNLYLTCLGRLEKWSDDDGDGRFETRAIVLDGFAAMDRRGLSGATLAADGWLYLTTGDNDNHALAPDGSRADLSRTGGVFRSKPDGSRMTLLAMGLRNPYRGIAFGYRFDPFLVDGDQEDGSKLQGLRLVNPSEEGDYGWRLRAGSTGSLADFDRSAVNGELPGKLPVVARLGRGSAAGLAVYDGVSFPEALRDTLIVPDPARRIVRGFKVEPKGGAMVWKGESTLMSSDDDQFRPIQAVVGADGSIYVLDQRGASPGDRTPGGGEGKAGRLYRITWEGARTTPLKPNNWDRITQATTDELVFKYLTSDDRLEAARALRELVDRGPASLVHCLGWASNAQGALSTRLLGIQGARQLWCDQVETTMVTLLNDPEPDVRRLAAQALAWEPKSPLPRLATKLAAHLDDADARVVREVALGIGRHAEPKPQQASALLLRWLLAHPQADPPTRDAFVRALERLGDAGVEEVALAIRTRRGTEREAAVAVFVAFRVPAAADRLEGLVKIPDLSDPERIDLIRQFPRFPTDVPASTQGLAEWVARHGDVDPSVKVATLDACRMAGNPASTLVLALLDDEDEAVREAATRIAARSRPPGALEILTKRLQARNTPSDERLALVRALRLAGPKAFEALDAAYVASEDAEFRQAALRSMADADRTKAAAALESSLMGPDPAFRSLAARLLGESPKTATALGKAFANRTVQRDELPIVLRSLRRHDNPENRKLLATIEEEASSGSASIQPSEVLEKLGQGGGDPWSGLGLFFRESSKCSTCHKVEGRGGSFGPPLTLNVSSPSPEKLVESILSPSKTVKARYESTRVKLKDGRAFSGLVTGRDEKAVVLREPGGREVRIAPDLIDAEVNEHSSPMPVHAALDLTADELADLVAFLRSRPAQDSLKHGPRKVDRVLAVGPFPLGADRLRVPLDRVDPSKVFDGQDGARVNWTSLDSTQAGLINLRGEMGGKPGRAYLAVEVRSAADQSAALRFAIEGGARVYLNGSRIAEVPEHDATTVAQAFARPNANTLAPLPDLARVKLKAGWNLLLVAVDRSDDGLGDVRATFELASPEPVELRTPRN